MGCWLLTLTTTAGTLTLATLRTGFQLTKTGSPFAVLPVTCRAPALLLQQRRLVPCLCREVLLLLPAVVLPASAYALRGRVCNALLLTASNLFLPAVRFPASCTTACLPFVRLNLQFLVPVTQFFPAAPATLTATAAQLV